jgi:hypothetical protein
MTDTEVQLVNSHRLAEWGSRLAINHCTPALLIGVGHDDRPDYLHICMPHHLPLRLVRKYLVQALAEIDAEENTAEKGCK